MRTLSLSDFKTHLSENVERAQTEHEQYTITRNGRPAAVLVAADEWEALQETLFWLAQPNLRESLAQAERDIAAGDVVDEAQVRKKLGLRDV